MLSRRDNVMVLVRGPAEERGPRIVSIPGRPVFYQEEPVGPNNTTLALPPIPFRNDVPWLLESAAADFSLSGERLERRLEEGLVPFLIHAVPLFLLLGSLFFILRFSSWPLANLFLGALAFRGILAAETFVNSAEVQDALGAFLENRFPLSLTVPLLFTVSAFLVNLYTFLVFLAGKRNEED
jgi:hypothetical protein